METLEILGIVGPGVHKELMDKLTKAGAPRPTARQTLFALYSAMYGLDRELSKSIYSCLADSGFLTSTENILGERNFIVHDDVKGESQDLTRLFVLHDVKEDPTVRIVPYGQRLGAKIESPLDLAKHPITIAQVGNLPREMIEKLVGKERVDKSSLITDDPRSTYPNSQRTYTALRLRTFGGSWVFLDTSFSRYRTGYALKLKVSE